MGREQPWGEAVRWEEETMSGKRRLLLDFERKRMRDVEGV
jgi:hypothetical protein